MTALLPDEHIFDSAFVAAAPVPGAQGGIDYRPFMSCGCGWTTWGDSWCEVGAALDAHLAAAPTEPSDGAS